MSTKKINYPLLQIHIKKNNGAALLLFILITITIASTLLLKALNIANPIAAQSSSDQKILMQAKEALIGYALSYADRHANNMPGYLPCPDIDGDGLADAPCGNANASAIGRFPWQTVGLPALRDSAGECLWYAVSGLYKENPQGFLSTDSNGQFLIFDNNLNSLNGSNNNETAIAIIFSSGAAIDGQNRTLSTRNATHCGSTRNTDGVSRSQNYLDSFAGIMNANGSFHDNLIIGLPVAAVPSNAYSTFINSGPKPVHQPRIFNDSLLAISAIDLPMVYQRMQQWLGERVRQCLNAYASANGGKLPWPAVLAPPANPVFNDNSTHKRFGRIASNLVNTQADGLSALWPMDPLQPTTRCFNWNWWQNVRETVFYAIDETVSPVGIPGALNLTVDTISNVAAILVAGRPVAGQSRTNGSEKGSVRQYLESSNVIDMNTGAIPPGSENFISSDNAANFFNDYVCTLNSCP